MIGDGWDGDPSVRPGEFETSPGGGRRVRRVAVVTGSRAEFGLLRPVMAAVQAHPGLDLDVIAAGSHLIPPAETFRDVKKAFPVTDSVPMQRPGPSTRLDDAEAVGVMGGGCWTGLLMLLLVVVPRQTLYEDQR